MAYIILALLILSLLLWRVPMAKRRLVLIMGLAAVLLGGFFLFQPVHDGVTAVTVSNLLAEGNGRPILVEFYSDY